MVDDHTIIKSGQWRHFSISIQRLKLPHAVKPPIADLPREAGNRRTILLQ